MIISRPIHVTANGINLFLWLSNIPLYICTTSSLPIHPSVDIEVFYVLAVVNNAAMNIGVHVFFFFWIIVLSGHMPRIGIAGFYGNSVFSFLRNLHSGYTDLHSHQQCRECPRKLLFWRYNPWGHLAHIKCRLLI